MSKYRITLDEDPCRDSFYLYKGDEFIMEAEFIFILFRFIGENHNISLVGCESESHQLAVLRDSGLSIDCESW